MDTEKSPHPVPGSRPLGLFSPCVWLLAIALTTSLALADGMVFGYDRGMDRWDLQREESQLCLINYENGIEKMLVSVALSDLRGSKAAWIVPIPASPDSTSIGISRGFPSLYGRDILEDARSIVARRITWLSFTQLYPIVLLHRAGPANEYTGADMGEVEGVSVHKHEERLGLTTELVTADRPGAIFDYLTEKGVELPQEARKVLDAYKGDRYSFVVTWISDTGGFKRESLSTQESRHSVPAIGIFASFPTRRAYFPLRPTSIYGYSTVPIDLYVMGHVVPALYPSIREAATFVDYYVQGDYHVPKAFRAFFNGRKDIERLRYTKVSIDVQSCRLTQDLWFRPGPPAQVVCALVLDEFQLLWVPLLFLLTSCLASVIAGAIALGRFRLPLLRQARFGLWNCLTIGGLVAATVLTTFREPGSPSVFSPTVLPRSVGQNRKLLFIVLFTLVFEALLALFYLGVHALI